MGVSSKQGVVEEINTGLMIVNSLGECRRFEMLNDIEMGRRLVWKFLFFFHRIQNLLFVKELLSFQTEIVNILDYLLKTTTSYF